MSAAPHAGLIAGRVDCAEFRLLALDVRFGFAHPPLGPLDAVFVESHHAAFRKLPDRKLSTSTSVPSRFPSIHQLAKPIAATGNTAGDGGAAGQQPESHRLASAISTFQSFERLAGQFERDPTRRAAEMAERNFEREGRLRRRTASRPNPPLVAVSRRSCAILSCSAAHLPEGLA
ncbi:hypothetical protein [Aureimonas leprariae]|uniref:Uncharacterized protein n=1 Tax=Plantimonas leprariae TaxID=2615207 RepID=A0A7V7PKQ5_9HYPH|nr:hypothetical protein [Aureimonas leprariae]KAB0676210.1 hypothetical protein F6X38_21970 [Aureimonas leprariae]